MAMAIPSMLIMYNMSTCYKPFMFLFVIARKYH